MYRVFCTLLIIISLICLPLSEAGNFIRSAALGDGTVGNTTVNNSFSAVDDKIYYETFTATGGQITYAHVSHRFMANGSGITIVLFNTSGEVLDFGTGTYSGSSDSTDRWFNVALDSGGYTLNDGTDYLLGVVCDDSGWRLSSTTGGVGTDQDNYTFTTTPGNFTPTDTDVSTETLCIYFDNQSGDPS